MKHIWVLGRCIDVDLTDPLGKSGSVMHRCLTYEQSNSELQSSSVVHKVRKDLPG